MEKNVALSHLVKMSGSCYQLLAQNAWDDLLEKDMTIISEYLCQSAVTNSKGYRQVEIKPNNVSKTLQNLLDTRQKTFRFQMFS